MSAQTPGVLQGAGAAGQTPGGTVPATLFQSPAQSLRSLGQQLEDERRTPPPTVMTGRAAMRPTMLARQVAQGTAAQGLLAAKESEAALLRQQLAQLTADFRYNLKLLEERDLELERSDAVIAGLKEGGAAKELALAEAQRAAALAQAALRDKEAVLVTLEERHRSTLELCDRQVADARASRDEEVAKYTEQLAAVQGKAAKQKSDTIARYEEQLSAATTAEREARQRAAQLAEENEHVRSQLQRAEARVAEQELGMQRMVGQFESALQTLQQLEAQYDALAADAAAAEQLRSGRIHELEAEAEGLRAARTAMVAEAEATASSLSSRLAESDKALAEVRQHYHRAMMDNADLTETLGGAREEAKQARAAGQAVEQELASMQEAHAQAAAALERERAASARSQDLLESARAQLEVARRDLEAQQEEAGALREAAALLEAQCNDSTRALEAAHAKLAAAEERARLLAEQVEQERALHTQVLASREAEVEARWGAALQAARDERATLQQTLDLANKQLAAAHRDMETLRLQLQHLRLAPPPPVAPALDDHHLKLHTNGGGFAATSSLTAASTGSGHHCNNAGGEGLVAATPSEASRDLFADLPEDPADAQPSTSSAGVSHRQQRELHHHIDSLADKLSGFERTAAQARAAGSPAVQQVQESRRTMPSSLQQRQGEMAAAAEECMRQRLAEEQEQYQQELRRLDEQLADKQRQVQQQEQELQRLREAEAQQAVVAQETQQARLSQQPVQQQPEQQQQRPPVAAGSQQAPVGMPVPAASLPSGSAQHQQQRRVGTYSAQQLAADQLAAENAALRHQLASMRLSSLGPSPATSSLGPSTLSPGLASSLSGGSLAASAWRAGGTAAAAPPPAGGWRSSVAAASTAPSSLYAGGPVGSAAAAQRPLPRPLGTAKVSSSRPGTGSSLLSHRTAGGAWDDPLARARQQVAQAKEYLRNAVWQGTAKPPPQSSA